MVVQLRLIFIDLDLQMSTGYWFAELQHLLVVQHLHVKTNTLELKGVLDDVDQFFR